MHCELKQESCKMLFKAAGPHTVAYKCNQLLQLLKLAFNQLCGSQTLPSFILLQYKRRPNSAEISHDHITPPVRHWFPVRSCITYKLFTRPQHCCYLSLKLHSQAPISLFSQFQLYTGLLNLS